MKTSLLFAFVAATLSGACSQNNPAPTLPLLADSTIDTAVAKTDAMAGSDLANPQQTSDAIEASEPAEGANDSESGSMILTTIDDAMPSDETASKADTANVWTCPHGQSFGPSHPIAWPFAIVGTERVAANGASVVWRSVGGGPLHVADASNDAGDASNSDSFSAIDDIAGSDTCGDFAIARDGLTVICVTPDSTSLQSFSRSALRTNFGAVDTDTYGEVAALAGTDAGSPRISHPLIPTDNTVIFEVEGLGIVASSQLFPGDPWSPPSLLVDPGARTLDGAYDTATLFLWDSTTLTTTIAWQWLDGHWELDPLGAEQHVTPNLTCTGAYYLWNGGIAASSW